MEQSGWNGIVLDTAAVPVPLDDGRFGRWMASRRVFVSSTMDGEMTPYRNAVCTHLDRYGPGVAAIWETLCPQDLGPAQAFLTGVDRSTVFLLMLGSRYRVSDTTGYSPTHQEANRAKSKHLTRLLFTLPVSSSVRDGKLNDWIRELHGEVSGHSADSPAALVAGLDARLREFAARSERMWLKLGYRVFTGRVTPESDQQGRRRFTVLARAYDHRVRH